MSKIDKLMDVVRIGEVEGAGPVVVESAPETDGEGVVLHPLVIINISDHCTRITAQSKMQQSVVGILLGKQSGRQVELFNSFEMVPEAAQVREGPNGQTSIEFDAEFLRDKLVQFKEVFKTLDCVGWYCTGTELTAQHEEIHKQMLTLQDHPMFKAPEAKNLTVSESPVLLLLDPTPRAGARELPLRVFEHHIEIVENVQRTSFVALGYGLASEEAERIGVDHIAKVSGAAGQPDASEVSLYLDTQRGAVVMLHQRIVLIRDYLRDVRDGKLPSDPALLRQLSALCSRLPIQADDAGRDGPSFLENANDSMLVSYLAMVTKGCSAISDCLDKFPMVHDKANRRARAFF